MKTTIFAMALCLVIRSATSQTTDSDSLAAGRPAHDADGLLTVLTQPVGAEIYVDSLIVGRSPVALLQLSSGRHVLRAFYPSAADWGALAAIDTVVLAPGEALVRHYSLGTYVRILTIPPGALVASGDSALGITPFVFRSAGRRPVELSLRKQGYGDSTISLNSSDQLVRVLLSVHDQSRGRTQRTSQSFDQQEESRASWPKYVAAASTIGFGIASAYFNHEANRSFELHVSTQDPRYLEETRKYDRAAVWSLAITQLSFGLLAYFLLLE
jgi:hypothetical protein